MENKEREYAVVRTTSKEKAKISDASDDGRMPVFRVRGTNQPRAKYVVYETVGVKTPTNHT